MKKVLFICPYPPQRAPSQRFRYEQYLEQLKAKGIFVELSSFLTEKAYTVIYQPGTTFSKIALLAYCFLRRFQILLHITQYNFIFIHREATPVGPPIVEWLIAKIFRRKIIYDFDDAIWLTDKAEESFFETIIRWRRKTCLICKWSYKVSCGNRYLASYAKQFNSSVIVNPTTIDTEQVHNPQLYPRREKGDITIGWTGSSSTLKYLEAMEPVLKKIEAHYPSIKFLVIADRPPALHLKNLVFIPWTEKTEIIDLMKADIGIMPLPDDEWTKGKCGFKALQYMALEIPAVASPVGVNVEIIDDGINGYLCVTPDEWFVKLEMLVLNPDKRLAMGKAGRQKIVDCYSVASNSANFLSLFH